MARFVAVEGDSGEFFVNAEQVAVITPVMDPETGAVELNYAMLSVGAAEAVSVKLSPEDAARLLGPNFVRVELPHGYGYLNPDLVTIIGNGLDKKRQLVVGYSMAHVGVAGRLTVKESPAELVRSLNPPFTRVH